MMVSAELAWAEVLVVITTRHQRMQLRAYQALGGLKSEFVFS